MATRKTGGLGRGLDAMIPKKAESAAGKSSTKKQSATKDAEPEFDPDASAISVDIKKVEPNQEQPRKQFEEEPLKELADSIGKFGILQPLLVQKKKDYYEIIAGERRWRAAKLAGLKEVPVIVKKYTDQEQAEIQLIENIQRENLNPIEEARAYKRLLEVFELKQEEVAERVSKSRTAITNSMRLLKLDERVQDMLVAGDISNGHGRALLAVDDQEEQYRMAKEVAENNLSVRDIEKMVKKRAKDETETKKKTEEKEIDIIFKDMEEKLKDILGTKVAIDHKDGKGKIMIEFYSSEEFDRLAAILSAGANK